MTAKGEGFLPHTKNAVRIIARGEFNNPLLIFFILDVLSISVINFIRDKLTYNIRGNKTVWPNG